MKRLNDMSEVELEWLEDFTDKVQSASFQAITEEISLGRSADIIITEAKKLADLLEFGEE